MKVHRVGRGLRRALPITTALLSVILLVTVGFTYYASNRILLERLSETNQAALEELVAHFDTSLSTADQLLVAALADPDVRDHMSSEYASHAERILASARIQTRLGGVRRSLPFVQSLALVSFRRNHILTDMSGTPVAEYADDTLVHVIKSASVDGIVTDPRLVPVFHWAESPRELAVLIVRPYPLGSGGAIATGGIVAALPLTAIKAELARFAGEVGLRLTVIDRVGRPVPGLVSDDAVRGTWQSQPVLSTRTGWVFSATVTTGRQEIAIQRFRIIVVVIAITGMILAGATMVFLDRRFRKPWQDVLLALAAEVESGSDALGDKAEDPSLNDIRSMVEAALNRGREMEWKYEASRSAITWQIITKFLLSPTPPGDESGVLLEQIDLPGPCYQVLLLNMAVAENPVHQQPPASRSIRSRSTFEDRVEDEDVEGVLIRGLADLAAVRVITLPDGLIAAVASTTEPADSFARRCRALLVAFRHHNDRMAVAALGASHDGTRGIHTSYVEAVFALEFAVVRPHDALIVYEDVADLGGAIVPRSCSDALKKLPETMHRRDPETLRLWASDFLASAEVDSLNPVSFKHTVARFVADASDTATRLHLPIEAGDRGYHHSVWAARSRTEIDGVFTDAVDFYCRALQSAAADSPTKSRGGELVKIVDEALERTDLSLTLVADMFGASTAHTSRLFGRTTGMTFQEYVAVHRISRAQDLLRTTHYTVGEIGRRVGFTDAHTFIRTFKRKCAATPSEYRRAGAPA